MRLRPIHFRVALAVFMVSSIRAEAQLLVAETCCEYASNPLGVDKPRPRFSWVLQSQKRAQVQSAYRVLVSSNAQALSSEIGDKWDSGKVPTHGSVNVPYDGTALVSGEKCFWKVRCWDGKDQPSAWSTPATFEMGLLQPGDWSGQWIGGGSAPTYRLGKFDQAVLLDGNAQCIRIPHESALKPGAQITIAAWVLPGATLGNDWREVYRKEDGPARHLLALGKTGAITGVWVGLGIAGSYVEFGANASLSQLKDGQWHFLAATYDGANIRLYVDGTQIGSKPQTGALSTSGTEDAYIGSARGQSEFFSGGVDDVRVYRRALSAAEIQAMFGAAAGADPDLVGWWKLDGDLINAISGLAGAGRGATSLSPLLRKEFRADKPIAQARVYISGVGWSELYLNGAKVGDHVLDPAATDYNKRVFYVTHDVTNLLATGANAIGVMLGNGWFSEPPTPGYGDSPRLRFQMKVTFTDGSSMNLVSDASWKSAVSPITRNDIFGGETYDARMEQPGWTSPGFNDSGWSAASLVPAPGGVMQSQQIEPIKVNETIRPVALTNPQAGIYVYNMGQVFGGWARFRVKGPAGTRIAIKYSARVFADTGLIDKTRNPEPNATDYYFLKGDPAGEVYEPRFAYHPVGYVQVEGCPSAPTLDDLEGRYVYSSVNMAGDFECSNALFNRIHQNAVRTLKNELFGFPLDCLFREHWGWLEPGTNPSTLFARKHMPRFWTKFLDDAKYAQHADGVVPDVVPNYPQKGRTTGDPAWAGNYPLLVWYLYEYYDDLRIVEDHYAPMKKWLDHLVADSSGNLLSVGYYGDHMLPGNAPGQEEFISSETPPPLLWTGYFYRDACIVSRAAALLGNTVDAQHYAELAGKIKQALNNQWLDTVNGCYATGSQTANIFPLVLGIVPDALQQALVNSIVDNISNVHDTHFHTGNLGTSSLMELSLASRGQGELMYEVLNQTTYPGYGYEVSQGATTLWESWGLSQNEESMDMWGSVDEFFYRDLAGIRGPDYFGPAPFGPGFRDIEIKPHVLGELHYASASLKTVRGPLSSQWKIAGGTLTLTVGIPVNSTARVSVPVLGMANVSVREGDRFVWDRGAYIPGSEGITGAVSSDSYVTFTVGSGNYAFTVSFPIINTRKGQPYSTIQAAIDAAAPGDEIVVSPGVYSERLVLGGKNLIIRGAGFGAAGGQTIIRGDGMGPVISFTAQAGRACQLVGLVVSGGANTEKGGGILCDGSSPTISSCCIEQNIAQYGGGLASILGSPLLVNCVFRGNSAESGGAVYSSGGGITLINCTLAGNSAPGSAALACRSPRLQQPGTVVIDNSILWDVAAEIGNYDNSTVVVKYSDICGGSPGTGNMDDDPLFVLMPQGQSLGDLRLRPCSPCIDAGLSALLPPDSADLDRNGNSTEPVPIDLSGKPRVHGFSADMGADESTGTFSLPTDLDGDCAVGVSDLAAFIECVTGADLGPPSPACRQADFDHDGDVDQDDFGVLQRCLSLAAEMPDPACAG